MSAPENLLTISQMSELLQIHRITLYRLLQTNKSFPKGFLLGRNRRWQASDVRSWLEKQGASAKKN